jgi:hypothetical protein
MVRATLYSLIESTAATGSQTRRIRNHVRNRQQSLARSVRTRRVLCGQTISGTIHVRYTDEQYFGAINRGVRLPEMWDASETRPYRNRQR